MNRPRHLARSVSSTLAIFVSLQPALAAPEGTGSAFTVPLPEVTYPLPVVENYTAQIGADTWGRSVNAYDPRHNPVIQILSGFDEIWQLGDEDWRNGGANGDGAMDYSRTRIVDPQIWAQNMEYVLAVTGETRDREAALLAYLDDRRHKGVSVLDGFGPFEEIYREHSGAHTTIEVEIDPAKARAEQQDDEGGVGSTDSDLGAFVEFMEAMRGPEGTSSRAKYFFASPRPWRMTDTGEVIETGTEMLGDAEIKTYDSNVAIVPALLSARETRGRNKDAAFPSGHTNAGYISALAYAYAFPERYSEMLTRASELGESRIVAGMHSPLDVIGGRIMATAIGAAYLNSPQYNPLKQAARENIHEVFSAAIPEGVSLMEYAQSGEGDLWADDAANKALYRERLTYGFAQDPETAGQEMIVPHGAEALLESRQPYLDDMQRRVVLYTTGIDSGYPVIDQSNGWGRLDLVAAADGYGAFPGDVIVDMDATQGGFSAADSWDNDISGPGMLTKRGSGELTLTGRNSFEGGTVLEEGRLVVRDASALGAGELLVRGGTLAVTGEGLALQSPLTIEGGKLELTFDETPEAGERLTLLTAPGIEGSFEEVVAEGLEFEVEESDDEIAIIING